MSEENKVKDIQELLDIPHLKTDDEVKRLICQATWEFRGQIDDLYSAVGCLVVGRLLGWRVLRISLNSKDYAKYQRILSAGQEESGEFKFSAWMRDEERLAYKSLGLFLVKKAGDFWAAVKGRIADLPLSRRRDVA